MRRRRLAGRTDRAYVWLAGTRIFLGPWGSRQARVAYEDLLWRLNAPAPRQAVPSGVSVAAAIAAAVNGVGGGDEDLDPGPTPALHLDHHLVSGLSEAFLRHAAATYRKRGRPTSTHKNIRTAVRLLSRAGLDVVPIEEAGPLWLQEFQAWLLAHPGRRWSRKTVNEYVSIIVQMFEWAVSQERCTAEQLGRLRAVRAVRKGAVVRVAIADKVVQVEARDGRAITPVDRRVFQRSRRFLPRPVRIMADLQLLAGMRAGEVCAIRPCHLLRTPDRSVMVYAVPADANKTEHHEISRTVYLGPRALRLLRMVWPADESECFFSPRKTRGWLLAKRAAARKTKRWPSHDLALRAARRPPPKRPPGPVYTSETYGRCVRRACEQAFGVDELGRPREKWTTHQLRHARATTVASREKLQVAQKVLGHASIATTMRYVKVRDLAAEAIAARYG